MIVACAILSSQPAHAADLSGPDLGAAKVFLVKLYSHYPQRRGASAFDPTGRGAPAVFDPAMIALFREDARLTPKGDEGAIDSDPICHCQDDDGMVSTVEAVTPAGPSKATAQVRLRFTAARPVETVRLDMDLVVVNGQWRIHDIHAKDEPSLRAVIEDSNRLARRAHR